MDMGNVLAMLEVKIRKYLRQSGLVNSERILFPPASPKKALPLDSLTDTCASEQSQFTCPYFPYFPSLFPYFHLMGGPGLAWQASSRTPVGNITGAGAAVHPQIYRSVKLRLFLGEEAAILPDGNINREHHDRPTTWTGCPRRAPEAGDHPAGAGDDVWNGAALHCGLGTGQSHLPDRQGAPCPANPWACRGGDRA